MPAAIRNVAREKLEQGQLSLGVGIRMTRSVEIAKAMAVAGFDWLFLDMEHGVMSLEAAPRSRRRRSMPGSRRSRACRTANIRSRRARSTTACSASSCRMSIPRRRRARSSAGSKYPPVGHRSMGGIGPHYDLRTAASGEAAAALNAANLTIVMIETPTAIANADAIAAVPGVDVLLIGTNDLCAEMGIHGEFGHDRVVEAYRALIAACKKHGKFAGIGGVYTERSAAALYRDGRALRPGRPGRAVHGGRRQRPHRLYAQDFRGVVAAADPGCLICKSRSPGESRNLSSAREMLKWVPAFAGTAVRGLGRRYCLCQTKR